MGRRSARGSSGGKAFQLKLLPIQLDYLKTLLQSLKEVGTKGPIVTLLEKLQRESGRDVSALGYHQVMLTAGEAKELNEWYGRIQEEKIPAKISADSEEIDRYEDISDDYEDLEPDERIVLVPVRTFVEEIVETRAPDFRQSHYLLDSLIENAPTRVTR